MKTYVATPADINPRWYLVDADGKTLGRLASELAFRLRGKHKPEFTPHADTGDYFVVVNAEKIHVTGNKREAKRYYRHTGYPGGIKSVNLDTMLEQHPERAIEKAVRGMLPKGPLGRQMLSKLKVYAGVEHPHKAQKPRAIDLKERGRE